MTRPKSHVAEYRETYRTAHKPCFYCGIREGNAAKIAVVLVVVPRRRSGPELYACVKCLADRRRGAVMVTGGFHHESLT